MSQENKGIVEFHSYKDLRNVLASNYQKQIENFFGDQKQALRFLSGVVADVQRNPKLLECTPPSVINGYMTMAQLGLMPSGVSGEAYVIPYNNSKKVENKWTKVMEAQFQLGYQGFVTLLYRAGAKQVVCEEVRENDTFKIVNGSIYHEVDPLKTKEGRGARIGAYAIITLKTGGKIEKFMRIEDIIAHGKRFSKSFDSEHSPWNEKNDPEGWMLRKTVLKQAAKLAPKNDALFFAIAEDNKDSNITNERLERSNEETKSLTMGNLLVHDDKDNEENQDVEDAEDTIQFEDEDADSDEEQGGNNTGRTA